MRRKLRKLVRKWKDRIWLHRWHIQVIYDVPDPVPEDGAMYWQTDASVNIQSDYHKAGLSVKLPKKDFDEDQWNNTICHELVHIANGPLVDFTEEVIGKLPKAAQEGWREWLYSLREQNTEHWTNVLIEAFKEKRV